MATPPVLTPSIDTDGISTTVIPIAPAAYDGVPQRVTFGSGAAFSVLSIDGASSTAAVTGTLTVNGATVLTADSGTWKVPVLCASTANLTLSGEQTIDGVLTSASRILVKDQSSATQNGIYVTAAGAWARASDASTSAELVSAAVVVQQGTTLKDTAWQCTNDTVTIGVTAIDWALFAPVTLTSLGVTAAAQTILDDATVAAMVDTLGGASSTGTGGIVRATSAALTTPNIGTPSAGTLTSCTGLPVAGVVGISVAAATVLDDATVDAMIDTLGGASATGTGGIVRATSPALTTPNIGTPSAGTLTNCTGLPAAAVLVPAIRVLTETVGYAAFTDGGGAVGTFDLTVGMIPAGAIFHSMKVLVPAGFAGDTSAALTVGDGSDVDRYNTGTIDVFTTAATGVQSGIASGGLLHPVAVTPRLTITTASDWGLVSAGSVTVSIYYLATA